MERHDAAAEQDPRIYTLFFYFRIFCFTLWTVIWAWRPHALSVNQLGTENTVATLVTFDSIR
jgi:hypothetical protein